MRKFPSLSLSLSHQPSSRNKRAEQIQKREQKQAAVQKQELVNKQMANIMDKYVKRIDKSSQVRLSERE